MLSPGKIALMTVAAGLSLGALLGSAANPVMKQGPQELWQLTGRSEFVPPSPSEVFVEAGPQDLSVPDAYRPDFDYDAYVAADWVEPAGWHGYGEDEAAGVEAPSASEPPVAAEAVAAADEAEQVAETALEAGAVAEAAPADEPRKPPVAAAGIY